MSGPGERAPGRANIPMHGLDRDACWSNHLTWLRERGRLVSGQMHLGSKQSQLLYRICMIHKENSNRGREYVINVVKYYKVIARWVNLMGSRTAEVS